ncbi:MAG TPA: GNAT family N-acetyltransferase, partial [Daejeonella sp.]
KENFIALPLLKRKIEGTEYFDCTSVYGYAGPISNVPFSELEDRMIAEFAVAFESFLLSEKIVSVFSRLHPLLNQDILLKRLGGLHTTGKTVAIDLTGPYELQVQNYRRAIRMKINQLRRKGFVVREANCSSELRSFVKIYIQNMIKVNASESYFFDEDYFKNLLNAEDFDSKLLLAYYNNEITSGLILTCSDNIMQTHLAATSNDFLHDAPMKLLFDEATIVGRRLDMKYLHLGGGVGGKEDSLFVFKSGFSNLFFDFKTWRYIANEPVYNQLVEERCKNKEFEHVIFPLYRSR